LHEAIQLPLVGAINPFAGGAARCWFSGVRKHADACNEQPNHPAMDERAILAILDAIYDASVDHSEWSTALRLLGDAFQCNVTTLIDRNIRTMQGSAVATGIDDAGRAEYFTVWGERNVFVDATPRWTEGAIVTDQQLLSKASLMASDYYNGFMRPRDMHSLLRISIKVDDDMHQSISLMRPGRFREFDTSDIERAGLFLPHLQRAAHVSKQLSVSDAMLQTVNYLLEENSDGVMLVDYAGRVIFANRAALAMAERRDGFRLRQERVEALHGDANRSFQNLLAGALGCLADPHAGRAGMMRFARTNDARDYIVTVTPIPQNRQIHGRSVPTACITIADPAAAPTPPLTMLQALYGLTTAELRIAEKLFAGHTPGQAADALNIKISTARTHIAQIFRKTDVRRQSDLIGLMLRLH
jgi:DNA-binding CsgD family transcriptional regulator/PAS domain-containing protein